MIYCFFQAEYSCYGTGHKIYHFSVQSGSGKKLPGYYGVGCQKPCPTGLYYSVSILYICDTVKSRIFCTTFISVFQLSSIKYENENIGKYLLGVQAYKESQNCKK